MPTIICPKCKAENQPRSLSALSCESCGSTIDPRELGGSPKSFIRRQRKLRRKSKTAERLRRDEADEMLAWILELPPDEVPIEEDSPSRRLSLGALVGFVTGPFRWLSSTVRRRRREWIYSDPVVRMSEDELVINQYYWPGGRKRIPYSEIRRFTSRSLKPWHGQYRVHGVDHLGRWYSRDRHRGEKELAIDLTVGRLIHPVLTPDDVETVLTVLERKVENETG